MTVEICQQRIEDLVQIAAHLFKSIWARPQWSQGCQKIRFLQIKLLSSYAKIDPKRHKLRKLKKSCQKIPVFLDFFKYSSIWGQSQHTKPQMECLVDHSTSFNTPGVPGVVSSRPVYYSILELFGQRTQYISIKFPLHKPPENTSGTECY